MTPQLNYVAVEERTADLRRSARRRRLVRDIRENDSTRRRGVVLARFYILLRRATARGRTSASADRRRDTPAFEPEATRVKLSNVQPRGCADTPSR